MLNPRSIRRWLLSLIGVCALLSLHPRPAAAHPLGNFTINLYSRLAVGDAQIDVTYIVDLAEIPTYQEFGGSTPSASEQAAYLQKLVPTLRDGLHLAVDGHTYTLQAVDQRIEFPAGQAGLPTTRITLRLMAGLPELTGDTQRSIAYADRNYADRLGWHEIVAQPAAGARFVSTDAPTADASDELRSYPQDMLASPLDIRAARLVIAPGSAATSGARSAVPAVAAQPGDRLAALITTEKLSPLVLLVALLSALGLGAIHALSPGHGKTIVAAYLIGSRGTARHALFLGVTVTATHTIGVFALGLITLYASRYILPEQLYPWLGIISGGLVVALGVTLLRQRIVALRGQGMSAHTTDHHHDHHHDHEHNRDHDHEHHHDHSHGLTHSHGGHTHTHAIPGADGSAVSWRSLLALGISGGLIPCPSALVVMLSAISLGRIGLGLLLIVMFSVGLAGVLTGVGLLFVHGKRWIDRLSAGRQPRLRLGLRALPVASAVFVTTAGLIITAQALAQAGVLR
ncbi:MAG TPA: sulfite exporter TauE/SafE family protein [Herpetosiphonaceae bacterium]